MLAIGYGGGAHLLSNPLSGGPDPNGPATDPIARQESSQTGCTTSSQPAAGGYTGYSQPLTNPSPTWDLARSTSYALTPAATQAQIDARVWDQPPSGPAYLMTRGTFRIDTLNGYDKPSGILRLPLYGNEWRLLPGHTIRLDLTQVDSPYLRPNNLPSSITYGSPLLVLPTAQGTFQSLSGSP